MAVENTTTLATQVSTLYEKKFLKAAYAQLNHEQGAQKRSIQNNAGKSIVFNRYSPKAVTTTPLTEGSEPAETSLTPAAVSCTLAEYGDSTRISRFHTLVGIDQNNMNAIENIGEQMGRTLDTLCRTELDTGFTAQLAGGKSAVSDVAVSDVLSVSEIRKAVRTLQAGNAPTYEDNMYLGKIAPYPLFDLQGDSAWVNASIYRENDKRVYNGEVGKIFGTRWVMTTNQKEYANAGASNADLTATFLHGREAFGVYNLSKDEPKLYILPNTQIDSGRRAGRSSIVSWAGAYVAKTLNSAYGVNIKVGSTGKT